MRAATWATNRDIAAARLSWERAQSIADALPTEDVYRTSMRIAPRTMLCGTAWRVHTHVAGARFDELRQLCTAAGDKASLAIAMAGLVMDHAFQARMREASLLASEAWALIESVGDPALTVGLSLRLSTPSLRAGSIPMCCGGHRGSSTWPTVTPQRRLPCRVSIGARLYVAGYRPLLGRPGWRDDQQHGLAMAHGTDPLSYAGVVTFVYGAAITSGVLRADDSAVRGIEDALQIAERSGDDLALALARMTLGVALVHRHTDAERDRGQKLLAKVSDVFRRRGYLLSIYRSSRCTWRVRGHGVEIAMTPYRSCAPPSTICSARDSCWRGAFQRRVFWWRHCSIAGPTVTWPKPRPRSSG